MTSISIFGYVYLVFCLLFAFILAEKYGLIISAKIMGGLAGAGLLIVIFAESIGLGNHGYPYQAFLHNNIFNIDAFLGMPFVSLLMLGVLWLFKK